jgi:predicted PurR-regulated permease PerM
MAGSRAQLSALKTKLGAKAPESDSRMPDVAEEMNQQQRRALPFAAVAALVAGFILLAKYVPIIILSMIVAVLFYSVYEWLVAKTKNPGRAAMLTFIITLLSVIIPLVLAIIISVGQIKTIIDQLTEASKSVPLPSNSSQLLQWINNLLGSLTGGNVQITAAELQSAITHATSQLASFFLDLLTNAFSGIASFFTNLILYIFVFTSVLVNKDRLKRFFKALNPLGDETSELYLARAGHMTKGAIGGQFIIAFCQGVTEAAVLYFAGIHYFFFMALILSFLSIIPLGGGIVAIPIGIIMVLTGNVWQGLFVLFMHFAVITNIDNVLRPRLIPKSVRMNSALMLLAVFGGIGLFGFLGIVIGPIIMVLVLTTLQIYVPVAEASHAVNPESEGTNPKRKRIAK